MWLICIRDVDIDSEGFFFTRICRKLSSLSASRLIAIIFEIIPISTVGTNLLVFLIIYCVSRT